MPKRISDVSLHVYVTPDVLDRIVGDIRGVLADHIQDRDVFAWRFTLPVDATDTVHQDLENQWRANHPGHQPENEATFEIALSLVGEPTDLSDDDIADLESGLALAVYGADQTVPFTLRAHQRSDVEFEPDVERL
ncbi:hypothetical protein [Nocardia rosealba]|uniref:hypothetical protein n=1 Tax=Nocardia rosealba TaxID=2878563 RepID=UPI001CDA42E8|nr:hypothetical protein [Nocardia rosealba]MCA2211023.1 hypothetical protein [Nocardia rosealba]